MKALCVFAGSNTGRQAAYGAAAEALGTAVAQAGMTLVYGGARVGLMGAMADAALAAGGAVVGVMPQALVDCEVAHEGLTALHIVQSMHERKALMAELSDGFVALPGGAGTLEELFEVWTWGQLGYHTKPCGALNVAGYYDKLVAFLDHTQDEAFIKPLHRDMLMIRPTIPALLQALQDYRAPQIPKWIGRGEE